MKLLIITQKVDQNDQPLGFFVSWLWEFAKHADSIIVLCLEKGNYELPKNVQVESLGKDRGESKLRQLFNFYRFIFTFRKQYDSVFVHMNPIWAILGSPVWKLFKKKIGLWYTHKSVTFKLRLAERCASVVFTASSESFRIRSNKVIVTGHGIDVDLFRPNEHRILSDTIKILAAGRIAPVKNYEILIEAASILKDRGVHFSATIVGEPTLKQDNEYLRFLKKRIENLNLQQYFTFVGKILNKDLPHYFQTHDVFVHPSRTGSLDKLLLEAMACDMKPLSSNDAARSFLPPDLLFVNDDPSDLANKIVSKMPDTYIPRDYVVKHHNLKKLIPLLIKNL